jgi:hypothetical protein
MDTTRIWGARIGNTVLPPNMSHWKLILGVSRVVGFVTRRTSKFKEAREQRRVRQVAELVREREAKRRSR